jgi:nucleotide-binding universal stress UspA family protein
MSDESRYRGRVVVGFDGSESSVMAARWAAASAVLRGRDLVLVQAMVPPVGGGGFAMSMPPSLDLIDQLEAAAREEIETMARAVRGEFPGLEVLGIVAIGAPSAVLLDAAETAELVVIGSRGRGGFRGLLLGSVGAQVAAHAGCPVAVLRGGPDPHATKVVVGIDGSPAAGSALRFAFDEASRRGWSVHAVHAWDVPAYDLLIVPAGPVPVPLRDVADDEVRLTAEALAGFREEYPDVDVVEQLVRAPAVSALLDAADGASMIVVGTHGRGPAMGALLGSVSNGVIHKAALPVVVVPPEPERPEAA